MKRHNATKQHDSTKRCAGTKQRDSTKRHDSTAQDDLTAQQKNARQHTHTPALHNAAGVDSTKRYGSTARRHNRNDRTTHTTAPHDGTTEAHDTTAQQHTHTTAPHATYDSMRTAPHGRTARQDSTKHHDGEHMMAQQKHMTQQHTRQHVLERCALCCHVMRCWRVMRDGRLAYVHRTCTAA